MCDYHNVFTGLFTVAVRYQPVTNDWSITFERQRKLVGNKYTAPTAIQCTSISFSEAMDYLSDFHFVRRDMIEKVTAEYYDIY